MNPTGSSSLATHPGPYQQRSAVRLQQHLSHYALSAIAAGLAVGYPLRAWTAPHAGGIGTLTTAAVFMVIYPMMVNLKVEALAPAGATYEA